MGLSETATPEPRSSARVIDAGWLPLVEPWTDDRPDPARWLATTGLERARREVEDAIRAAADPIVVSGPTGHGKTLLLRSLQGRPPSGFAPLFVPFASVEPDELAAWILAWVRRPLDRDPGAELAHLLRANTLSGERTLLLVDEVQAMPRATLSKLLEIIAASGVAVSVVLAGLSGDALDAALGALPRSIRKIAVAEPWSRSDAELLFARVAFSLGISLDDLLAAVDVDSALCAGSGNPRLVRAALAVRLRAADPRASVESLVARPQRAAVTARRPPPRVAPPAARVRARAAARSALHRVHARAGAGARSALAHARARGRNLADRLDRFAAGVLAAGMVRIRRTAASGADFAQTRLESAARRTLAVSTRTSRSVRVNARRLGVAAQTRAIATAADLRALSRAVARVALARSATGWSEARSRARQSGVILSSAHAALRRRALRALTSAAPLLARGRARLALLPVHPALSTAGSVAALAIVIARASLPTLGAPPGEPIHVSVNSHPWSHVELDGVEAGATPFTIALEPGPHHFRVAMADGRVLEKVLVVSAERDRVAFR